jgi:hypothetical protein
MTCYNYTILEETFKVLPVSIDEINEHLAAEFVASRWAENTDTSTVNAIVLSTTNTDKLLSYATGTRVRFFPPGKNTGDVTLNVDQIGQKRLFLPGGTTEVPPEYLTNLLEAIAEYDETLDTGAGAFVLSQRNEDENEYDYIYNLIFRAIRECENITGQTLLTKKFRTERPDFCLQNMQIRRSPKQVIESVKYYFNDALITVDPSEYLLKDGCGGFKYPYLILDESIFSIDDRDDAVLIEFTAGFGLNYNFIPPAIKDELLRRAAFLYQNRGDCQERIKCDKSSVGNYATYMIVEM